MLDQPISSPQITRILGLSQDWLAHKISFSINCPNSIRTSGGGEISQLAIYTDEAGAQFITPYLTYPEKFMSCDSCEIKNVIYRYADLIDRGDLHAVAAMFGRGKIIAVNEQGENGEIVGADAIYRMYSSFARLYEDDGTPHTQHMTSNVIVNIDEGGATASSQAYAMVFQSVDDFPLQPVIGVRYYDKFAKTDEAWHFTERRIASRLFGDLSRHLLDAYSRAHQER